MKKKFNTRKKIIDEFTNLLKPDGTPMSRQQKHMLRKKAQGICLTCSKPAIGAYCPDHTIRSRERMRKKSNSKRRNLFSASYIMERKLKKANS